MKLIFNELRKSVIAICIIAASFLAYFLTDTYCGNSCGSFQDSEKHDIFIWGILGFIPTLILFFLYRRIVSKWLNQVGWWFSILYPVIAVQFAGGGVLNILSIVVTLMMALLFVITLVYALVMNRKLKQGGGA